MIGFDGDAGLDEIMTALSLEKKPTKESTISQQESDNIVVVVSRLSGDSHEFEIPRVWTWGDLREKIFQLLAPADATNSMFEDYFGNAKHLDLMKLHNGDEPVTYWDTRKLGTTCKSSRIQLTVIFVEAKELQARLHAEKTALESNSVGKVGERYVDDDLMLCDIGVFADHVCSPGVHLLHEHCVEHPIVHGELLQIIQDVGGLPEAKFTSAIDIDVLSRQHRESLIQILDERCGDNKDFKLDLRHDDLVHLIGEDRVRSLTALFPNGNYNEIKLRRCCEYGKCINFHTDFSLRTMQIPLNGDDAYSGGRLIYLNAGGVHMPSRPAGSVTIHDNTIAHGVSVMGAGVRYGLFLLKTK